MGNAAAIIEIKAGEYHFLKKKKDLADLCRNIT
jgi:hypothetical protein